MSSISRERVKVGQAKAPEIELVVSGDENYARYETPEGYAVVYDVAQGLFCHVRVVNGRFESTGIPASLPAPPGSKPHEQESPEVRREKSEARQASRRRAADG